MKLTIIRHAKAEPFDQADDDFQRNLAEKGIKQANTLAEKLADIGWDPSLIISSAAFRCWQTAQLICQKQQQSDRNLKAANALYLASYLELLQFLAIQSQKNRHIALVAHNPGVSDLINYLCPNAPDALATCDCLVLDLGINNWYELTEHEPATINCSIAHELTRNKN